MDRQFKTPWRLVDRLEEIYPEPSVYPPSLKQQTLARLFEVLVDGLLGSASLALPVELHGRKLWFCWESLPIFPPQGTNEEIDHFGEIIAQRMESKRSGMGASEEALPVFESLFRCVRGA